MANWADIAAALPYGWDIVWALKAEGISDLFVEFDLAGTDPTGYTSDASLVIEDSDKLGTKIDAKTGIGRSYDMTFKLLRTTATQALFSVPDNTTSLALTDFDWTATGSVNVEDTTGFAASGRIHIGREAIDYTGKTGTTFTTLTRGQPNSEWRAYQYDLDSSIGTWVTDSPTLWRGRLVELFAIPVNAYGGTTGADILADAAMVWRGHIQTEPFGSSDGWVLSCRSQERRLTDPVGVEASGKGQWVLTADPEIAVEPSYSVNVHVTWALTGSPTNEDFTLQPFAGYSSGQKISLSQARADFVTEWNAVITAAGAPLSTYVTTAFKWEQISAHQLGEEGINSWWIAKYEGSCAVGFTFVIVVTSLPQAAMVPSFMIDPGVVVDNQPAPVTPTTEWLALRLVCRGEESISALRVTLDEGDPSALPTAGYVIVEIGEDEMVFEYTDINQLADDGSEVRLTLAPNQADLNSFAAGVLEGSIDEFAVRFASKIGPDSPQDNMRKMLLSSGRGDNDATYDTEPRRAGYDLDQVDTDSFDDELDENWTVLGDQEILLEELAAARNIWGGLLALSGRNIVSTPEADGSAVKLRVVPTSLADAGTASTTITDSHLLFSGQGSTPVRQLPPPKTPNVIRCKLEDVNGEKMGQIIAVDRVARDAQGDSKLSVEARGIDRDNLVTPVGTWAASRFADAKLVRVFQLDVVPWLAHADGSPLLTGDVTQIDSRHPNFWELSDGSAGYQGPARILGRQIGLRDYSMRLTVGVTALYSLLSLAPSAQVLAFAGPAGAPTSIDIHADYFNLMTAFLGSDPDFDVIAYIPSLDDATTDGYTIDAVTLPGNCRLNVSAVIGAPTLSTSFFLTIPVRGSANARQLKHLHNDTPDAAWR